MLALLLILVLGLVVIVSLPLIRRRLGTIQRDCMEGRHRYSRYMLRDSKTGRPVEACRFCGHTRLI